MCATIIKIENYYDYYYYIHIMSEIDNITKQFIDELVLQYKKEIECKINKILDTLDYNIYNISIQNELYDLYDLYYHIENHIINYK